MEDSPIPDILGKDANDGAGTSPRSQGKVFRYLCNTLRLYESKCYIFIQIYVVPASVFRTRVLWRPGSKKSLWPRGCWILRSDLGQEETLRTRSCQSCRRGKQS